VILPGKKLSEMRGSIPPRRKKKFEGAKKKVRNMQMSGVTVLGKKVLSLRGEKTIQGGGKRRDPQHGEKNMGELDHVRGEGGKKVTKWEENTMFP